MNLNQIIEHESSLVDEQYQYAIEQQIDYDTSEPTNNELNTIEVETNE